MVLDSRQQMIRVANTSMPRDTLQIAWARINKTMPFYPKKIIFKSYQYHIFHSWGAKNGKRPKKIDKAHMEQMEFWKYGKWMMDEKIPKWKKKFAINIMQMMMEKNPENDAQKMQSNAR